MNPWSHWEKMLPGTVILQWDMLDVEGKEEVLSSWLWFGAFSWESRMSPRHWRKAFLFISFPHLSLCQLCNSLSFSFCLAFINTWFNFWFDFFFFFPLLFEQVTLSGKDEPQRKCSFFQEHNFVFLCSSIFVKIQEVWFSIDGLFLRDFFNIVKIVKFCLKNLLSEKPWLKCLKCLSLRCLWYALCSKLPQMFDSFSFLQKQHHSQASIVLFYIKSQWRVTSMIAYLALSYMCSWKRKFCNNHTKEKLFITLISPKDCLEVD